MAYLLLLVLVINFVDDSVLHFRVTGPEGFPVAEMTFTSLKVIESNTIW